MPAYPQAVEFLTIVPLFGHIVFAAVSQLLTHPFRPVRPPTLYRDVLYGAIRCMLVHITIAQSRYLNASTSERYMAHCKKENITPQTLEVKGGDGTIAAHWIGRSDAEVVVLYLHGGGYTQSATAGNFQYLERLVKDISNQKSGRSVAVLVLAYTLVPEATHPTQLREATAMLSHLLTQTGRTPSDVIISGDSAGGNLALAVLSHLLHPHPDIPPITLERPLGGTLLYSPWAGFGTNYPSYRNEPLDMLAPLTLRKWSAMFLNKANPVDPEADPGSVAGDAWTEACLNPASWWNGLQQVVDSIFVSYGSAEVLADPIRELERALKTGWANSGGDISRVTFFETAHAAHVAPIVDIMVPGNSKKSDTQVIIEAWYKTLLQK